MIALGSAVDMPVDATALPVAAAGIAPNDQYADAFTALLGQMLGDAGDGTDADDRGVDRIEIAWDDASAIDPNELVNQLIVDGGAPILPVTVPTVWNLESEGAASTPSQTSVVDQFAATLSVETIASSEARAVAPKPEADLTNETAQLEPFENVLAAETAPAASPDKAPLASGSAAKPERHAGSARTEKPKAEEKVEASIVRPMPAISVERAYANNEREPSRSFERPGGEAPAQKFQSATQPMPATAFVVPADVRPLNTAPDSTTTAASVTSVAINSTVETHVPAQIVQSIRMQAIDGGGEAIVRLRPEYLGEVVVAVKVEQGSVTAALQADTPAVRQWVERNEAVLRQGLAEHGLQLDRLTVSEKAGETENERHPDRQQQQTREEPSRQQSRRRRPQEDETTFEVTV